MPFGLPARTISTRWECMYATAPACFRRSDVMKMPLITVSHFFAFSAGIRPGNAVLTGFEVFPNVSASECAMSTSKPVIAPLEEASSIGGKVGSVQNVKLPAWRPAPAVPATTSATIMAGRESRPTVRFMSPPLLALKEDPNPSACGGKQAVGDLGGETRVDRVRQRRLAIAHLRAGSFEQLLRAAAELDGDHVVERPVADRDRRQRRLEVELEALDDGDEAGEGDDRRRPRSILAEPERVAHHGALREAAEDRVLRRDPGLSRERVEPAGGAVEGRVERLRVGRRDAAERVPMRAARRERERAAQRHPDQAPLRVEEVEQRVEV